VLEEACCHDRSGRHEDVTFNHTTKVPLAERASTYHRQYIGCVDGTGKHWM
jgi:hypothetical protein